jgi:D-alanine-D-alanine ligase
MKILVLYGGVSTEHEVAIVTALQVMSALKEAGHEVLPGYISKQGEWFLGDDRFLAPETYRSLDRVAQIGKKSLVTPSKNNQLVSENWLGYRNSNTQIDAVFPVFHGRNGEDGAIQGMLNLMNLPYVGCQLIASATGMDKYISKQVARGVGLRVAGDVLIDKSRWEDLKKEYLVLIKKLGLPLFVKPVTLGSTIGITRVDKWQDLENAIEVGLAYDQRVLVEEGIEDPTEINISIIGNNPYVVSVTEEPVRKGGVLSFADKYLGKGGKTGSKSQGMASADRYIPARVDKKMIEEVEESAKKFFGAIGGKGISRIDFMLDKSGKLYFNEINTMPGSLSFYLWEKSNLKFKDLVDKLVNMALDDYSQKQKLVTTFESNILAGYISGGTKGAKTKRS